ncbi:Putative signal transduction response regulator, receiver domain, CheY-like superfamily [Colletotrichum destructivum]|uniref:Signal transduction response regulator, receiver domain, CheY-like superfamily n=1 Tax=Colletotrichum destructivum TaxID=34406 RepID=A0AAX4HYS4_9PEZI|nr:Putative signal transduction response regulator, receiver domain, CheY-like superfamily [Colletotrichum destructivum]
MSVQSRVGLGPSVSVTLPLSIPVQTAANEPLHAANDLFLQQCMELSGLRIRLLGFEGIMLVIPNSQKHKSVSDMVLVSEDALTQRSKDKVLSKLPCVAVCVNALVAHQRCLERNDHKGIAEFISQPAGPRKLAKVLLLVFDRWAAAQADWTSSGPDSPLTPAQIMVEGMINIHQLESPPFSMRPSMTGNTTLASNPKQHETIAARPKLFKSPSLTKKAVEFLLMEDNPINLKILCTYMNKLGRKYHTATNGLEAVEAYKRKPLECKYILTDVSMPVMDGFEATRQIRAHERVLDLKPATIIALTGLALGESQNEAFGSGLDLFLTKPVKLKDLSSILKSYGVLG